MEKSIDVCGIGNGLVDILIRVPEIDFLKLGYERGSSRLLEPDQQEKLLESLSKFESVLVSGGSVANSVIAVAQLEGKGSYLTSIGDDRYGLHYQSEFETLQISFPNPPSLSLPTGTCATIITPDGERTMRFSLGGAQKFGPAHIHKEAIARSKWLFIEGYLLANPPSALEAINLAVDCAINSSSKVALTLSEQWIVEAQRVTIQNLLPKVDLLFANETEACALTGASDAVGAAKVLDGMVPNYVLTVGDRGVYAKYDSEFFHTKAFPCIPLDLTGAGDMLAGAYLYGLTNSYTPQESAKAACFLAREVITRIGARLSLDTKKLWKEVLSKN